MRILILVAAFLALECAAQTPMETEPVKELKPTGGLSTCGYKPVSAEEPFFKKLSADEQVTGSFMKGYDIRKEDGKFVSWFGVVRGLTRLPNSTSWELLLEHKYFDGLTDCHIMLVSNSGSGDFAARLDTPDVPVPALTLIRVYGTVGRSDRGMPLIRAEFVRVWPWMTFTFTDLGAENRGNARWRKECKVCGHGKVYRPYPDRQYYLDVLGDPAHYGAFLK